MELRLRPEMEDLILKKVESGEYASAADVVEHALTLLGEWNSAIVENKERFKYEIQKGIDDLENGRYYELDDESLPAFEEMIFQEGLKRMECRIKC